VKQLRNVAFDVDGTLADFGCPIPPEVAAALRALEGKIAPREGKIILATGKPAAYAAGLIRGMGLSAAATAIVGENGAEVFTSGAVPPDRVLSPVAPETISALAAVRADLDRRFGGQVWYQPNRVVLTPFPILGLGLTVEELFVFASDMNLPPGAQVFKHDDCIDITVEVTKREGMELLLRGSGMAPEETIAVGDGINDIPLFGACGVSICVSDNKQVQAEATHCVDGIMAAFVLLDELLRA